MSRGSRLLPLGTQDVLINGQVWYADIEVSSVDASEQRGCERAVWMQASSVDASEKEDE